MGSRRRAARKSRLSEHAGLLGSLALSQVTPRAPELAMRALRWQGELHRLGVSIPFFITHDLGLVLAAPAEQRERGPRVDLEELFPDGDRVRSQLERYAKLIRELSESQLSEAAGELSLSDDLITVLLSRLLAPATTRLGQAQAPPELPALESALFERLNPALLQELYGAKKRSWELRCLEALLESELFLLTTVDAMDLDTLRLFGLLGGDALTGALAQVDLLTALDSPEAHDVVNFSLEILPSVLEAKAKAGAGSVAAFGYAGLARKGSIDSMVLTELAWDDAEFMRRMVDDELLYYSREQHHEEAGRIHYLLIDASASMRGERSTFARGVALATAKKLLLEGEDVSLRFFDARLYEPQPAINGKLPLGHLLSFKGERGRNPARVFSELVTWLELAKRRDGRDPILHFFTHSALHIPRDTVAALTRAAQLSGVFMLPSGGQLELGYLDLLDNHWVVDHSTLAGSGRADAARGILDEVAGRPSAPPSSRRGGDLAPASRRELR